MNLADMQALSELIAPEEEEGIEASYQKGSIFKPSDIGNGVEKKEIAKPFQQIEIKVNDQKPDQQVKQKKEMNKNDIWNIDDVPVQAKPKHDNRLRPDVEVLFKQQIGTEDVFGGWQGMDPSSNKCKLLLLKIKLPQAKLAEINLEVLPQEVILSTTRYYLQYVLPYPVNEKQVKAKFVSDKDTLELELQMIREDLYF